MENFITILSLAAALFVFWKLRSVLGTRNGNEPAPPPVERRSTDARVRPSAERGRERTPDRSDDNVVTLPRAGDRSERGAELVEREADASARAAERAAILHHADGDDDLRRGLEAIALHDDQFDPDGFLEGARMAYEMIVTGFADGDKATLRNLLAPEVYESFAAVIDERRERGETVQASFVGIEKARIVEAGIQDGAGAEEAHVTVDFVSQMVSATLDKAGAVVDGDPEEVAEVTDRWTFARPARSDDPNWNLVATDA